MNTKTRALLVMLLFGLFAVTAVGCGVASTTLADLSGWDLSACEANFNVCFELFQDNADKVIGGGAVIDSLLGG